MRTLRDSFSSARFAVAVFAHALLPVLSFLDARVLRRELVALCAMGYAATCLYASQAPSFPDVNTTLKVHGAADRLQVARVDAATNSAQVIKIHSLWNWADEMFVGQTVCQARNGEPVSPDCEARIALAINSASPQPTAVCVDHTLSFQTFWDRSRAACHASILTDFGVSVMNRSAQYQRNSAV